MKIKQLTKEQIIIATDRLTRFKNTEIKYLRVFKELILHNLITPKYNKHDLDFMDYNLLKEYAQNIINFSVKSFYGCNNSDDSINKKLAEHEKSIFILDENTKKLLDNNIDYQSIIKILPKELPYNLCWLKNLNKNDDIKYYRQIYGFKFPPEIVIIAEGATEEILLPEFAKLCDFDFDKEGVILLGAGGKNQVVRMYYELSQSLKLPIFVLLDKDGAENAGEINPRLRKQDKIYIIKSGEFEDMLPKDLVSRTLNNELENISIIDDKIKEETGHRVKYLEDIFKNRGLHSFKKAEFAKLIKENISNKADLSNEITDIISEIKKLKSDY